ncbi:MAG: hypothetical protein IPI19_11040 [Ignavibacteriales bacterium]|nr:hypothetical protein [Ignavibacteriales bacterium]
MSIKTLAQDYVVKQIKIEDGLSQSTIFASLQDSKGYMWFATRSGLNRYDGYKFLVYFNDPKDSTSLSDDGTNSLFESKDGSLWIGTIYGNINRFNRKTETFTYKNISSLIKSIPDQADDFLITLFPFQEIKALQLLLLKKIKMVTYGSAPGVKELFRLTKTLKQ